MRGVGGEEGDGCGDGGDGPGVGDGGGDGGDGPRVGGGGLPGVAAGVEVARGAGFGAALARRAQERHRLRWIVEVASAWWVDA